MSGGHGTWSRFITPALFVLAVVVNVTGLLRLLDGADDPVRRFAAAFVVLNLVWLLLEVPVTFRLPRTPPREVATLLGYGLTRVVLVAAAVTGPLPWRRLTPLAAFAVVVFGCGVGLRIVAMRTLGRFYSHHVIRRADHSIVRTGPYRFSRNPIYLSFILLVLGLSVWTNDLWLLVTLIPAVGFIAAVVIPREERFLERAFPDQYSSYKAVVRRWL